MNFPSTYRLPVAVACTRLVPQVALKIGDEGSHGRVPLVALLGHRLANDPVEIAAKPRATSREDSSPRFAAIVARSSAGRAPSIRESNGGSCSRMIRRMPAKPARESSSASNGGPPGEQLVQQRAQAVNIAPRVDVDPAHVHLLGAHVNGRAQQLVVPREIRVQLGLVGGLGDSEVDDLWQRLSVELGHENIGRFDVAMDHALLVRVQDRVAHLDEKMDARLDPQRLADRFAAVMRSPRTISITSIWPAGSRRTRIEDTRDIRVIHQRERLPLGTEARDDLSVSIPRRMILSATRRRTGSSCSAS